MGGIFSHKNSSRPKTRITKQDEAILQLKCQRDKLRQYARKLESGIAKERETAKALLKQNRKERALLLLKKKRYEEQLVEQTLHQISNVENMIYNVETAQIQIELVEGLKLGNECLKKMHDVLSIETVEKIMDETRELVEYQKEIDALVAGQLHEEDLYEIEREYEELVKDASNVPELPEVPSETLPKPTKSKATKREKVALKA